MIVFLLCMIVAILLFGSSKVLGAFANILGLIVIAIGLIALSKLTGLSSEAIIGIALLIIAVGAGYFAIFHPEAWESAKKQNKYIEEQKKKNKL